PTPTAEPSPPSPPEAPAAAPVLSPVVRRLVAEHGIDPSEIVGTGEGGRITRRDVERYLAEREAAPAPAAERPAAPPEPAAPTEAPSAVPAAAEPAPAPPTEAPPAAPSAPPRPLVETPPIAAPPEEAEPEPVEEVAGIPLLPGDEVVELPRLRRRIAENLVRTKRETAHVFTSVEVDYEAVARTRARHREEWRRREGFGLTYLPFVARATVDALEAYPAVNSSFYLAEGKQVFHSVVNLGIAVDLDQRGLVVVTIPNADSLTLRGLARAIREKADKARAGRLDPDDIAGSTFSITNPGPFGSYFSVPILNLPNVAILSTDTVVKRPVVVSTPTGGDAIAIRHVGILGLTWDHRAFDGSTAVLFLRRIKENLETWDWEQELA
ncbi:MAG TPA: dihydrolipoyllysine-residue succinyltransferase, partial [Actinobacteria bacterium]|nr:dihydrolipoyllysine-residue succinyltransferase [Actinomycetota bacterium]